MGTVQRPVAGAMVFGQWLLLMDRRFATSDVPRLPGNVDRAAAASLYYVSCSSPGGYALSPLTRHIY